jgi:hypothetical protein
MRLVVLSLLLACTRSPAPICRTSAECAALDGKRVTVLGTYRALPHPKGAVRGETEPILARIDVSPGDGPYLEPFWNARAQRDAAELRRFDGKRVHVTGTFHAVQPRDPSSPPYAEAMGGSCLSDVEGIVPAD